MLMKGHRLGMLKSDPWVGFGGGIEGGGKLGARKAARRSVQDPGSKGQWDPFPVLCWPLF